ncbi:MAG: hypothetical protein JOZ69_17370, partial [Myxococcales bacterium]|nr:hypothetical protein [Myxococcales bacterium]
MLTGRPGAQGRADGVPAAIEHLVVHAARVVQALAALAPRAAASERGRLAGELVAGGPLRPRWSYAPVRHDAL